MPLKKSFRQKISKPVKKKRVLSTNKPKKIRRSKEEEVPHAIAKYESAESREHVKSFLSLETYLISVLRLSTRQDLDMTIIKWAYKKHLRSKKWERLVRAGERLKELQLFARNYPKLNKQ